MPDHFTCFVRGIPAPQGSKRAFNVGDRAVVVDVNPRKLKDWRSAINSVLQDKWEGPPLEGAVSVELNFQLLRPPSVSEKKRPYPSVMPDIDKLARAALDAMTGIVFRDDAQVVLLMVEKVYVEESGLQLSARAR